MHTGGTIMDDLGAIVMFIFILLLLAAIILPRFESGTGAGSDEE